MATGRVFSALVAGRLGGTVSGNMRLRITSGRRTWHGLSHVVWRHAATRKVHLRKAVRDSRAGRFASASEGVLRAQAAESACLTPGHALELAKRPSSDFDHRRRASSNLFDVAEGLAFLTLRNAGRVRSRRKKWDRELFEENGIWHLRHRLASIRERPTSELEHATSDTGVDFRFDPSFDDLPELFAQIGGLVHAREFK